MVVPVYTEDANYTARVRKAGLAPAATSFSSTHKKPNKSQKTSTLKHATRGFLFASLSCCPHAHIAAGHFFCSSKQQQQNRTSRLDVALPSNEIREMQLAGRRGEPLGVESHLLPEVRHEGVRVVVQHVFHLLQDHLRRGALVQLVDDELRERLARRGQPRNEKDVNNIKREKGSRRKRPRRMNEQYFSDFEPIDQPMPSSYNNKETT